MLVACSCVAVLRECCFFVASHALLGLRIFLLIVWASPIGMLEAMFF